jgi:hypothetical protein
MVASLPPANILGLLLPYADLHKNPKVRGKAGSAAAEAAARMAPAELAAFGLPRLLAVSGKLVTGAPCCCCCCCCCCQGRQLLQPTLLPAC